MADSGEDWDKLIDSYDRTHRGASMSTDDADEDLPPPPPPPPPAAGRPPPPPPSGAPPAGATSPVVPGSAPPMPGAAGIAAALNARFAAAGGSPPPPARGVPPPPPVASPSSPVTSPLSTSASPPGPSPMAGMGGIAAAIAARNAANAASANGAPSAASFAGRRDSNPPPPPPQKPGPPPPPAAMSSSPPPPISAASSTSVSSVSTPGSMTPGSVTPGANGSLQRPSLLKALGSAAGGLWNMIQTAGTAVGGVAAEQGPLAPVMQELSAVYSPFPDSSQGKKNLAAIKVVVTAPRIRRMKGHGAGPSAGSVVGSMASSMRSPLSTSADGDDDESLWEEAGNQRADFSNRHWLRFIEPKSGSVLYFNVVTNSAQGERPADYDGSDDEDDDEDMDYLDESEPPGPPPRGAEGMPQPVNFASPRRARQESIILNEAWDEMGKSGAKPPPTPGSLGIDPRLLGVAKVDGASGRNSIQASGPTTTNEEEFVPVAAVVDGGKNATAKANVSLEGFLSSSTLYMKQLEQLLEAGSVAARAAGSGISLSDEMESKLKMLLVDMQDLQRLMDTDRLSSSGNDVDTLLQLDKLPWDFSDKNMAVQRYRQTTWGIDHKPFEYRLWHMPQYLSTFPLPPDTKAVTIVVKLPEVAGGGDGAAATTRIGVTEKDTCSAAIAMAIKKCSDRLLDKGLTVNDWVLKGMGIADYMYGDTRIMDYECIRMAVRNGEEVKLTLVRKPAATPDPEVCATFVEGYKSKLSENVTVHDPNSVFRDVSSKELKYINMNELTHLPFRFKVLSVDNVNEQSIPRFDTISDVYIKCYLFYGCKNVADPKETQILELSSDPRWFQWMVYKELTLANFPRGARLGFIMYGHKITKPEKEVMLGWVVHQLVDDQGFLTGGRLSLRLWSMEARKKGKHGKPREPDVTFLHRATTAQNLSAAQAATLTIQLDEYNLPVVAPISEKFRDPNIKFIGMELPLKSLTKDQTKQFEGLLACDILKELTPEDQQLLWNLRHHLVKNPGALSKFLQCVNWGNVECRMEAYRLLKIWATPASGVSALELLDAKFPDPVVREYAISQLRSLRDDELRNYLLQMVQCLKFEPYHDSPLKRFLIERALANPMNIGHYFFWHLKAEVHAPMCCERFGLILEEYLSFAGRFTLELKKQASAVLKLQRVAEMVVRLKRDHGYGDPEAMKEYSKECEKLNADFFGPMGKFQLPLDPKIEVTSLVVEKCRYMSSKMVPLWLVFKNADPDAPNVYVIFKSGDDLRQDILTLQILSLMDSLWLSAGTDCKMKPYKCIATGVNEHGEGVGLIEVVLNSDTTSGIQLKYGGGAVGALKMDPLDLFLREHNKIAKDYEKAVENFVNSCAGYCVATFVLGIGDRHNGNIMVTKDGHLFHIDFGHFLGNFKSKFGINRERAAFVFTPEMAYVMGGNKYRSSSHFKKFLEYCAKAFLVLRKNANLLENLFGLMVAAGMPELIKESDIYYMRDKLYLNEKESKAEKKLNEEIENSLDSKYRRLDNFIHNWRHG